MRGASCSIVKRGGSGGIVKRGGYGGNVEADMMPDRETGPLHDQCELGLWSFEEYPLILYTETY